MKTTLDCRTALNAKAQRCHDATMGVRSLFRFSASLLIGLILMVPPAWGQLVAIPLDCQRMGNQLVLRWTNPAFSLQCAPSVHGVFTNLPGGTSPHTNALSGAERYFRLLGVETPLTNMVLIPAGSFTMGDTFNEGDSDERPTHEVYVSAFYMDKYEVTKAFWDEIRIWANAHGYDLGNVGAGKGANHPVQAITWYEAAKWCNARSEKEARVPAYYTSAAQTTVYRTGQVALENAWVKWDTGYRLPTEAEWEKAARSGAGGHRFPWTEVDTITHAQANYQSTTLYAYDVSSTRGHHPSFKDGVYPYTSPVGSFAANGYGLYDMSGNLWELCWDWYSSTYYGTSPATDPRGPTSGSTRARRGGSWWPEAIYSRTAKRFQYLAERFEDVGFRCVLSPGQ